jgi:hypothetical protein
MTDEEGEHADRIDDDVQLELGHNGTPPVHITLQHF